jgi:hypothetical protein
MPEPVVPSAAALVHRHPAAVLVGFGTADEVRLQDALFGPVANCGGGWRALVADNDDAVYGQHGVRYLLWSALHAVQGAGFQWAADQRQVLDPGEFGGRDQGGVPTGRGDVQHPVARLMDRSDRLGRGQYVIDSAGRTVQ